MSKQRLPGQLSGQSGGHRTFFFIETIWQTSRHIRIRCRPI